MKTALRIMLVLGILVPLGIAQSQGLLLKDDFTAASGTALTSAGWTISGTTTTNPLTITSPSLTFVGHPGSGVGASVPMANTGQDVFQTFKATSTGSVYLSFLVNVSAALTGDYFVALSPSASQTNYYARLHVKSSGAGYSFGISKSNEVTGGAQYGTTVFSFNTTYFVAMKYTFTGTAADSTNDPISVYVLPAGTSLTTEPTTPEINAYTSSSKTDATDLASVTLRQGSATAAPTLVLDAVRVGTSWNGMLNGTIASDSVNVTFNANTATVPDTLKPSSFVQIRGSANVFGPWSSGSSAIMKNVAGDYWKVTTKLKPGDTIQYKFFTNVNNPLVTDAGWENDTDPGGNRVIIVGSKDTTVPLQFVNGTANHQLQYFTPYVNQKDSIEVWFRVNMASNESFKKGTQFVGVRGGTAPLDWGKSIVLTQESPHGNGGSRLYDASNFYSGYARFPKSAFTSLITYKYVILDAPDSLANVLAWETVAAGPVDVDSSSLNRAILKSPGISDTTLYWKWWANTPFVPFKGTDTVIVTFRANMASAIALRGFTIGDTLQVRSGYGGTAAAVRSKPMVRSGLTGTIFTATDTVVSAVGTQLNYQYYLVKSGNDVREVFYDFDYTGTDVSQAERRKLNVTSKNITYFDTSSSALDMRRMPKFQNLSHLSKAVKVTYTINMRPAFYQVAKGDTLNDIQGTNNITKSTNIKTQGVIINGPAVGGWGSWGPALATDTVHKMFDDGTHGDVTAGDSVYSLQVQYALTDYVGQEFKFGIGGSDNEGGKGGFGNNHIENIDDSQTSFTIASDWGSINPKFYNTWDFTKHTRSIATSVQNQYSIPMVYTLDQNYPNPFNPSTNIQFSLPTQGVVTLKIFNVLGQEIMTLLHEKMDAGRHEVRFDASRLTSGVYLYEINVGSYVATKKMVLLK